MSNFFAAGLGIQPETYTFGMAMAFAMTTPCVNASTEVYTPPLLVRRAHAAFSAMRRRDEALGMAQLRIDGEAGKRERGVDNEGLAAATSNKRKCL